MTPKPHGAPHSIPLALVGCDFRVASSSWRSALVLSAEERQALASRLRRAAGLRAFAVLDTCNRTEWLVESPHPAWTAELLKAWMLRRWRERAGGARELPQPFVLTGSDAVRHFVRVAVGLESFVPGEREIAGQCTRALLVARGERLSSPLLDELAKSAGRAVRRLERLGRFRDASRGVHALAISLLEARLPSLPGARVGIAGMGAMGRKLQPLLQAKGARVVAFNRTTGPGVRPLASLAGSLDELDALLVTTGALAPTVLLAPQPDRSSPLLVLDLGVPAQASCEEGARGLCLLGLDDLRRSDAAAPSSRDVELASELAEAAVTEVLLACARRTSAEVIRAAQAKRDELRDVRLPQVLDEHLPDLPEPSRRKLLASLRGLMTEQHRVLVEEVERNGRPEAPTTAPARATESVGPATQPGAASATSRA